jgi:hypothetical protein
MGDYIEGLSPGNIAQAALQAQETPEFDQRVAAVLDPGLAQAFGFDVLQRAIQIGIRVEKVIGLERQAEDVPGHDRVIDINVQLADPALEQPLAVFLQEFYISLRPIFCGLGTRGVGRQVIVPTIDQGQIVLFGQILANRSGTHNVPLVDSAQPSIFGQAAK